MNATGLLNYTQQWTGHTISSASRDTALAVNEYDSAIELYLAAIDLDLQPMLQMNMCTFYHLLPSIIMSMPPLSRRLLNVYQ